MTFTRNNIGRVFRWCGPNVFLAKGRDIVVGLSLARSRKRPLMTAMIDRISSDVAEMKEKLECWVCFGVESRIYVCENGHIVCAGCFNHLRKRDCYCSSRAFTKEELCSKRLKLHDFLESLEVVDMKVVRKKQPNWISLQWVRFKSLFWKK
jgi:hypothetical protein